MIKGIYNGILTINSIVLIVVIYCINNEVILPLRFLGSSYISYGIYILLLVFFSGVCIWMSRLLPKEIIKGQVCDVQSANSSYLPSYLGYFFVALSISKVETLIWILALIFIFNRFSQTLLFNPMFLLFRYKFYQVKTEDHIAYFVITKRDLFRIEDVKLGDLRRINNYTFIDVGRIKI